VQKLVTPRLIGAAAMLPMLTIISDFVGMFGGFIIAVSTLGLSSKQYWTTVWQALAWDDILQGAVLKPLLFAIIIALIGCFYGLRATGGTQGVGRATTQAMVTASMLIFVLDALVTKIILWFVST
jgi:phospholipid/cholesterol/gamma-HCH transport system permease protein